MPLEIQHFGKTFVGWKINIPARGSYVRSEDFHLDKLIFELVFKVTWDESSNDEKLTMTFNKRCQGELPPKCILQSYIKDKGNHHLLMVYKEITQSETDIWSYTWRSFFHTYPSAEFANNSLTFGFLFSDFWISKLNDILLIETKDESVQTSPHHEGRLCLENLSLDFRKLMEEGSDTDVQLKCGDSTIPAHRLILSSRSEVFRAMLQSDMVERREGSVEIVDMEPKEFEVFVRYLYCGTLPELTTDTASALYAAGDKYSLEALRERCSDFLAENLTLKNACRILVMADAHRDKDLKDRVVSYILNKRIPVNDDEWPNFCEKYPIVANEVLTRACKQLAWI